VQQPQGGSGAEGLHHGEEVERERPPWVLKATPALRSNQQNGELEWDTCAHFLFKTPMPSCS
jgi:hypothetical protein